MTWFYATVLIAEDSPSNIDFGGSHSESVAARIALRVSNKMQRDTVVVSDEGKDGVRIHQTIRWKGYETPLETLEVAAPEEPRTLRVPLNPNEVEGVSQLAEFIDKWTLKGHAVTVSRCAGNPGFVNAVASR